MYIPPHFRNENEEELIAFIRANSFGLLVSNGREFPEITHLPFALEASGKTVLSSHFAAANPQAQHVQSGDKVTVVFNGPHAYISPTLYDAQENVPTWNYIAVHAHGTYQLCNEEEKETVLRKMIAAYEPSYEKQFDHLPENYFAAMKKGIVAFRIEVSSLQGKYKLSQNKKENERARIIAHLDGHPETSELATYMKKEK